MNRWQSASAAAVATLAVALNLCPFSTLRAQPLTDAQIATLTPVPPSLVPRSGNFFSRSHPEWPPLPAPQSPTLPIYRLPDSSSDYLVDDTSLPPPPPANAPVAARSLLNQQSLASQQRLGAPMLDDSGLPSIPGLTNPPPPVTNYPPQLLDSPPPTNGTFWMLAETNWPPFPIDPCPGADVWLLDDGTYLVNDTGWSWPLPSGDGGATPNSPSPAYAPQDLWLEITGVTNSTAYLTLHGTTSGAAYTILTSWSPTGPWNAELPLTGADQVTPFMADTCGRKRLFFRAQVGTVTPQFLWLQALGITNGYYNLIVHGTSGSAESLYDILSTSALTRTNNWNNWAVETNFPAATGQYWTPVSIPLSGRPNLFLAARSWISSTGRGIPDWWLLQYLLPINTDPYSLCPSGDGWTILQAYQNGWNPNLFYTPPPPQNVRAALDSTGTNATIAWASGGGPVTNYAIWQSGGPVSGWAGQVDSNTFSFRCQCPLFPGALYIPDWTFQVRAYFTDGTYADSLPAPVLASELSSDIAAVRGPGGQLYLVLGSVPPDLSSVRLDWNYWDHNVGADVIGSINLSAGTFVSGVAALPVGQMTGCPPGSDFNAQCISTNGSYGLAAVVSPYPCWSQELGLAHYPVLSFVDARPHLKENLKFLLQSATVSQPFSYGPGSPLNFCDADPSSVWFPEAEMARPSSPTNYEYYGFHVFSSNLNYSVMQEVRPAQENYLWRNFAYDPEDFDSSGGWTNGAGYCSGYLGLRMLYNPNYQLPCTNCDPLPLGLSLTNHAYLYAGRGSAGLTLDSFPSHFGEVGVLLNETNHAYVPTGVRNIYGLPLNSVLLPEVQFPSGLTLAAGGPAGPLWDALGIDVFCGFQTPSLQTVDYYFASQTPYFNYGPQDEDDYYIGPPPPLPGSPAFSVTNTSPLLITGLGQPITVSGWAKQTITNPSNGKYAYLEQYFTNAYTIDGNGKATTNSAGLLSPYGEFFPMQPGPAALVTMPDIDTGQQGTGVVNVIKLQLDVNHDGTMDLSFGGPDNTSQARPFTFWINNDFDRLAYDADDNTNYEDSVEVQRMPGWRGRWPFLWTLPPDSDNLDANGNRVIPTQRDLEDFARLWVWGVTTNVLGALPPGTTITLDWGDVGNPNTNNPAIDLFQAADPDGGVGYLTNAATAMLQTNASICRYVRRLGPGQQIQLNSSQFTSGWAGNYFIWCGVGGGSGQLTLTISQGGTNTLAQTSAYIQLVDIKQMYERWTVGDDPTNAPTSQACVVQADLPPSVGSFQYAAPTAPNTSYILFVHGWNLDPYNKDRFAETAFKRLYWQGYQGRFGSFRWPTDFGFTGSAWQLLRDPDQTHNFDRSERQAWRSGTGLLNKLSDLNAQYPGRVYLLAHSMGNVVAGEALRLAGTTQLVNAYVASQAAITAHTYDPAVPNYSFIYPGVCIAPHTPNIYGNWFAGNNGGGAGRIISFFNANDFALRRAAWQLDQLTKPDQSVVQSDGTWTYAYNGSTSDPAPWNNFSKFTYTTNGTPTNTVSFDIVNIPTNRYEVMAFAAQSWTTALGATPGVNHVVRNVDLSGIWPGDLVHPLSPFDEHFYHSGQFRGPYWQQQGYWTELLGQEALNLH